MAKARKRKTAAKRSTGKRGTRKAVKRGRRPGRPPGRPRRVAPASGGMQQALSSLQATLSALQQERLAIDAKIEAIENAMRVVGAPSAGRGTVRRPVGRPRGGGPRAGSLKDHILQVLGGGQTMAVRDITEGVVATGYQSKNKTLAKSVGIALTEMPQVQKVARGQFRLK